ncbi:MAG: hypothetical protein HFF24_09825 [Oscillospiraceae bacterium]|nr:hypothetical protein [Oscillospiraceae bacterium]
MRQYKSYMDHVKVSGDLHRRLAELEGPGKRPVPWVKYASLAAALALVCGLGGFGAWAAHINSRRALLRSDPSAYQGVYPELGGLDEPDIALEEPGDAAQPGMRTLGGYEVAEDGAAAYYVLPYIEYGEEQGVEMPLDWDVPPGAVKRELTQEDIAALLGGEDVLADHLAWGVQYVLTGWAAWYEDGSFWGAYINGVCPNYGAPASKFEFAVTEGQLPPTCIVYPGSVEQNIGGVMVTANSCETTDYFAESVPVSIRQVSFLAENYGYRFEVSSGDPELAEELVSRLVRRIIDQGITPLGQAGSYTCPGCGAYIEAGVEHDHTQDGSPRDRGENWCGTPGADTEAYPSDSFLTCRTCGGGVPDGTEHYCKPDGSGGHVCGLCGAAFPEGKVHSHEVCGLPLAPETWTCETCGEPVQHGMAHDCTMCSGYPAPHVCEMCGEAYPEGTAHACRQGGHHQGSHH